MRVVKCSYFCEYEHSFVGCLTKLVLLIEVLCFLFTHDFSLNNADQNKTQENIEDISGPVLDLF